MTQLMQIESSGRDRQKDISDNLENRNYAELFIENNINLLSQLKVRTESNRKDYIYVGVFIKELIDNYDYKGASTASAVQRINSVFSAMRIPYTSIVHTSKDAISKKKVSKKPETLGQITYPKEPDCVLIYRYADEFNPKMYATVEANEKNEKGEIIDYEEPTEGVRLRVDKWLNEIAANEIELKILKKVGFDVSQLEQ
jgi:hypothetical protein